MEKAALKFKGPAVSLSISLEDKTLELTFTMRMENQLKFLLFGEISISIKLISLLLHGLANMEYLSWILLLKEEI